MEKLKIFRIFLLILFLGIISSLIVIYKPHSKNLPAATPAPAYQDFHLLIPKLNVEAPVIPDVDGASKDAYFKALEDGVAHFKGSAKPGEGSNIFIFGHSSYYWWKPGNYKEVFKNLEDLKVGDEIILWFNLKEYKYKISETKVVEPDQVDVLSPTPKEQVILMTCVPVGTTLRRLIVIGKPSR